ncbi:MAG: DegT/DnrJ/EryC1/StrS aminotransferase family protein [Gammaproteobacteria bacterium]|nr:DegT/DnrJ/EryC1/StrS aminotransferase family protein [Gammaproteobacteria bacterium]
MIPQPFKGSFTQQEPISEQAIAKAVEVMHSGRLHRYNTEGENASEVSMLEREFAAYQGKAYCLACASGGYAMQIALRAAGLQSDEPVLTNAFTMAPVPGAIIGAGGTPVFIEINHTLVPDLNDLTTKIEHSGARFLLLSLMRGHLPDMQALMEIVEAHDLVLIEDCAHTMGASWDGLKSGNFGLAGCFSTQTYKHLNSGEGGLLVSDDAEFISRAIMLSGSYMLYERHLAAPDVSTFSDIRLDTPNCSGRMDNLRAAILRPQLENLSYNVQRWNRRYRALEQILIKVDGIRLPTRPAKESFVGSSIQFLIPGISASAANAFLEANKALGVELKWFGNDEPVAFTSKHSSWRYIEAQSLPRTDKILNTLFDMRIPLTFSLDDCRQIGEIIAYCANELLNKDAG